LLPLLYHIVVINATGFWKIQNGIIPLRTLAKKRKDIRIFSDAFSETRNIATEFDLII